MENDPFSTPASNSSRLQPSSSRTLSKKRDSFAAELERDPELSSAKRHHASEALAAHMAQSASDRRLLAIRKTKRELEQMLKEKDSEIHRLEKDRRWLAEREDAERKAKEEEKKVREAEKTKYDNEIRRLRTSLRAVEDQYNDLQEEHSTLRRETSETISTQQNQLTTLEREVRMLQEEVEDCRQFANDRSQRLQSLERDYEDLSMNQDSIVRDADDEEESRVIRDELHRQSEYVANLEAKNARLERELSLMRDRHQSIEVLREEKRSLEKKLEGTQALNKQVVSLEEEVRRLRKESGDRPPEYDSPSRTPVAITQKLSSLRMEYASIQEKYVSLESLVQRREAELAKSHERTVALQKKVDQLQDQVEALHELVSKKEQAVISAERKASFHKAMGESYRAEKVKEEDQEGEEVEDSRIHELEDLLEESKARNHDLEEEIAVLGGDPRALGANPTVKQLNEELGQARVRQKETEKALEEAQKEINEYLDNIDNLEQKLYDLQGEIGAGRHVAPGTRILTFKDNPAQQWTDLRQATMDRLKKENEALIGRLRELEESGKVAVSDGQQSEGKTVPRESWEVAVKEKEELAEVVKQKEKRLLRLQQVFQAKSTEFREAIANILGFKLAFYANGQIRVTSQYDLSASFVFSPVKPDPNQSDQPEAYGQLGTTKMQLVAQGSETPLEIGQLMRYWVESEQCLPGFMASVTLECWEKWKREHGRETEGAEDSMLGDESATQ